MEEEKEPRTVKIRTKKGRILTITISKETNTHIYGTDKFKGNVILPKFEIYSMLPWSVKYE